MTRPRLRMIAALLVAFGVGAPLSGAATSRPALANAPTRAWATDGSVFAIASTPSEVYVGGDFTLIGPQTGPWARVDAAGAVTAPQPVEGGYVYEAVSDGAGGWFIAGDFDSVGGIPQPRPPGRSPRTGCCRC